MSETSNGEVGEVKKEFQLLFLSQSEKWCHVKGIFERTLSAIVEKKSLKTSETVEGSDVIELSSFNEILEGEFVDFEEIISWTPNQILGRLLEFEWKWWV